jgi:capsular exopolysaccharide synthesis family protein
LGTPVTSMPTFAERLQQKDAVTQYLQNVVVADVGKRDDVISIRVRSPYPEDARKLAAGVVAAFYSYHFVEQQSSSRKILELLFAQRAKYEQELAARRKAKLDFLRDKRMLATGISPQNPTMDRLSKLSAALTEIELETLNAQASYEATREIMNDPDKIRQLMDTRQFKTETENLRREFRELRKRLAGLSGQYLPNFPELGAIQESLKQLNEEMAQEDKRVVEAYLSELESRLKTAQRIEDQIRRQLQAQRAEVLEMNDLTAQYQILESEIAALEKTSDAIDTRIKELSLTEGAAPLNIKVVEAARENYEPVSPAKAKTLFYALFGGGMLGVMLAFLRDWMDQRLRSADEIKQVLNLPVLGVVPHILATSPSERGMQLHLDPMSDVAESYRTVRTAVYFGVPAGRAKTLLITSPAPGEGKTTLTSNLAIAMAQAGNRILLLDADFRKPTQHKIFSADKSVGLSSVLAEEVALDQAIHPTGVPGLDLLPCGPIPANPSEILNSQMFADLLQELSRRYDHVLLDSPPVVPVTDARILAASADATVIALRAEQSTRKTALYARDVLRSVGANILGVVVNDVPRRRGVYGYYYAQDYIYQYGYGRRSVGATSTSSAGNGSKARGNGASSPAAPSETVEHR